jgi:hypothetical protein
MMPVVPSSVPSAALIGALVLARRLKPIAFCGVLENPGVYGRADRHLRNLRRRRQVAATSLERNVRGRPDVGPERIARRRDREVDREAADEQKIEPVEEAGILNDAAERPRKGNQACR